MMMVMIITELIIYQQVRRNTVFKTTGLEDWVVEGGPRGQCFVKEDIR